MVGDCQVDGVVGIGVNGVGARSGMGACAVDALSQSVFSCSCDPFPTVTGCGCIFRAAPGLLSLLKSGSAHPRVAEGEQGMESLRLICWVC